MHSGKLDLFDFETLHVTTNKCTLYWAPRYDTLKFNVFGHRIIDSHKRKGIHHWIIRSNNSSTCFGLTNCVAQNRPLFIAGGGGSHYIFNFEHDIVYNSCQSNGCPRFGGNSGYSLEKADSFTIKLKYDTVHHEMIVDGQSNTFIPCITPASNYRLICILLDYEDSVEILNYNYVPVSDISTKYCFCGRSHDTYVE